MPLNINTDSAAVVLRNHMTHGMAKKQNNDVGIQVFRKAAHCIDKFMKGENIDRIARCTEDPFPLPDMIEGLVDVDPFLDSQVSEVLKARRDALKTSSSPLNRVSKKVREQVGS